MFQVLFILTGLSLFFSHDPAVRNAPRRLTYSKLIGARPSYWCNQANTLVNKKCLDIPINHLLLGTAVLNCQRQISNLPPLRWSSTKKLSGNNAKLIRHAIISSIASYEKTCETLGFEKSKQRGTTSEIADIVQVVSKLMVEAHMHDPDELFQYLRENRRKVLAILSSTNKKTKRFDKLLTKTTKDLTISLGKDANSAKELQEAQARLLADMSKVMEMYGDLPKQIRRFTRISSSIKTSIMELHALRMKSSSFKSLILLSTALVTVLILTRSPWVHMICSFCLYLWSTYLQRADHKRIQRGIASYFSHTAMYLTKFGKLFCFLKQYDTRTTISFVLGATTFMVLIAQSLKHRTMSKYWSYESTRNDSAVPGGRLSCEHLPSMKEPTLVALRKEIDGLRALICDHEENT